MFNPRQLLSLELSCRLIAKTANKRIRQALATNLSDLLRYQNMLCRYDTTALKSLDIFSVHSFPVGLIQCESNFLGIVNVKGSNVGSGGWSNIVDKYIKAKRYCEMPYEVQHDSSRSVRRIPIKGEQIGEKLNDCLRNVSINCKNALEVKLAPESLDAVFTDPPYFGNVQYGELMDFCYVWLQGLVGNKVEGFDRPSTRSPDELTGNVTQDRGLEHFTEGLSRVYSHMAHALKPGAPLVFTYHHNSLEAYYAVGVAILDAGFICSMSPPCPAEMEGSIHIHGTASSIVDTVFVCRVSDTIPENELFNTPERLIEVVRRDLALLATTGRVPTHGDARCVLFGHLTRMALCKLRNKWNCALSTAEKIARFSDIIAEYGDPDQLAQQAATVEPKTSSTGSPNVMDGTQEETGNAFSV